MSRLTWDGTAKPVGANADRATFIFPFQLTMSRIGNHTRLVHNLAICVTKYTYIHRHNRQVLLTADDVHAMNYDVP